DASRLPGRVRQGDDLARVEELEHAPCLGDEDLVGHVGRGEVTGRAPLHVEDGQERSVLQLLRPRAADPWGPRRPAAPAASDSVPPEPGGEGHVQTLEDSEGRMVSCPHAGTADTPVAYPLYLVARACISGARRTGSRSRSA